MKIKLALAGILLSLGLATPALAHGGGYGQGHGYGPGYGYGQWELIGTRQVDFRTESDRVAVRGYERFRQIKVCVYNRPVHFLDMDVRFANGGRQDIFVRDVIRPGDCTRAIDLRGHRRDLHAVSFIYRSLGGQRRIGYGHNKAIVQVFAR
ncbi:MAG: hypothetical protein JNK07_11150 [Alphaproteobacteria bacterium]|nr:hypothetical protein [Alphaproteobacteria bacterium]